MNIEQIASAAKEVWSAGDAYIGPSETSLVEFLRICLSKLAAQQDVKPVAFMKSLPATNIFRTHEAMVYFTTNPDLDGLDNEGWTKLFTEAQLIAAQQRTAEACAKVCEAEANDVHSLPGAIVARRCAEEIRRGEWREYL